MHMISCTNHSAESSNLCFAYWCVCFMEMILKHPFSLGTTHTKYFKAF